MTEINPKKYEPYYISERNLPQVKQDNGGSSWNGCRVAVFLMGQDVATFGEVYLNGRGRLRGRAGRNVILKKVWKATGEPTRSTGFNQSHVHKMSSAFGGPQPDIFNASFDTLLKRLDTHVISLAVKLSVVPSSSPLRKWTSANHQILVMRKSSDGKKLLIYDPMAPQSVGGRRWVPKAHVKKGAEGFSGSPIAELFPRGGWTSESLVRKRKNKHINGLVDDISDLKSDVNKANGRLLAANQTIQKLEILLEECQGPAEPPIDVVSIRIHLKAALAQLPIT